MDNFFPENLIVLRKEKGVSKQEMATMLNVGRSTYYGYENGESFPTFSGLLQIADFFRLSLDKLVSTKLATVPNSNKTNELKYVPIDVPNTVPNHPTNEEKQDVLPTVSGYEQEFAPNVFSFDTKAAAGEAMLLLANDKLKAAPDLYFPGLGLGTHIRTTVGGDSMHSTIKDGDKVIATHLPNFHDLRPGYIYLILDKEEGLVCKRVYFDGKNHFEFISDNEVYKPYKRHFNDILALFKVREVTTTDLRPYWADIRKEMRELSSRMSDIERWVRK